MEVTEKEQTHDIKDNNSLQNEEQKFIYDRRHPLYMIFLMRLINVTSINTFFQPDEFFQSLEPAHFRHYGYGTLTWEWKLGLRSYLYPLIFDLLYYINDLLEYLNVEVKNISFFHHIFQAFIMALSEYYLYTFIVKITKGNQNIASYGLLLSTINPFNWFLGTRTFSNSFEMQLTTIALAFWPWNGVNWSDLNKSLSLAAVCFLIRPTNGMIWACLAISFFKNHDLSTNIKFLKRAIFIGSLTLILNIIIDYHFYHELKIPIWEFMKFNAFTSLSKFYGSNSWSFHLVQSLPLILTTSLPFFIQGFFASNLKSVKVLIIANILAFSLISHKEFRFLYPLQPFFILFSSFGLNTFYIKFNKYFYPIVAVIIAFNTALSLYLTQFHEMGSIEVIEYLRTDPDVQSIGFLTPCHSTPLQSYIHNPDIPIWYLTCEPPIYLLNSTSTNIDKELESYMDESDIFYENPNLFLFHNLPPPFNKNLRTPGREYKYEWPTHLVFFEALEPILKEYLKDSPYEECKRFWNTLEHWDSRRQGDVIVYCKWPWE
ncbi:hypothetical protein WICMUC_002991 [Wickerhamomyces mucosus]|uniref:Mannosyltransferase n=1 Tax=Wickerhamomyces mucosus TaxID=1378264 RepID=A0A9P8PM41_9ASCO|nr:hypothetical protein WICMUC_002991 [Wickerhamomyces mucosus]